MDVNSDFIDQLNYCMNTLCYTEHESDRDLHNFTAIDDFLSTYDEMQNLVHEDFSPNENKHFEDVVSGLSG